MNPRMIFDRSKNDLRALVTERLLPHVETPGRYIGGELNSVVKDPNETGVAVALAFPDAYEIGMSHLGIQLLYGLLNSIDGVACERTFAPWPDMESLMRKYNVPLFSLENYRPLGDFDVVGFSLQYEMSYTNVLNMLDLAGIPLFRRDRKDDDPIIIAGGPGAMSPEPLADFIDIFVLGDGEDTLSRLVTQLRDTRDNGSTSTRRQTRRERIHSLVKGRQGLYAPCLYDVDYAPDGTIKEIRTTEPWVPATVNTSSVRDLNKSYFPEKPIVPLIQTIHDRITLEVMRGCTQGCRFCQAGMIRRPTRVRTVSTLVRLAESSYKNTGHDEISLAALSISDYPRLEELLSELQKTFDSRKVNISLPSLRVSDMLERIPPFLNSVRKSSLTLAPEAARDSMKKTINKDIKDDDLYKGVRKAFELGWNTVKLYFLVGLPGENDDDIDAIVKVAYNVSNLKKEVDGSPASVNLTVAPFVPKTHTPFQWEPMVSLERFRHIKDRLRDKIRHRRIRLKFNNPERSMLEGVFSRGDRRLGRVIHRAWEMGCRFDSWEDHFDFQRWQTAFEETGLDIGFYLYRRRGQDETLPWSHINAGVNGEFLRFELSKSAQGIITEDCFTGDCPDCGACPRSSSFQEVA
ncbi:MAG: TIGR03960 family B12-binding radical SAM protein [Planctomycetota bacterium]